jgi:hypothetical protein
LKYRCLKWVCIAHLDIWNISYGQKKGRKSNWQFDSWPLKVRNRPDSLPCVQATCDIPLKRSRQGLQLCFRLHCNRRFSQEVMHLQSCGSPSCRNFGTPIWESRDKSHLNVAPMERRRVYTIKGKVVASPKSGLWWVLCVRVTHGSS